MSQSAQLSNSPEDRVEALRRVRVFADLPEDQLQWFADNVEDRRFAAGEMLFRKGDPPDWMAIFLEGEMHAYWDDNAHDGDVYIARAGDPASEVTGMLPFSRMTEFTVTGRAVTESHTAVSGPSVSRDDAANAGSGPTSGRDHE